MSTGPNVTFKGTLVLLAGKPLVIGDRVSDFTLVSRDLQSVKLDQYKGKAVVLATAPSLDTPVCQMETEALNDFAKNNPDLIVLMITKDLTFAQNRFCGAANIQNVVTLSDMRPNSTFGKDSGTLITSGPLAGLLARSIVLLDAEHVVCYTELVSEITDQPNMQNLQKAVDALK